MYYCYCNFYKWETWVIEVSMFLLITGILDIEYEIWIQQSDSIYCISRPVIREKFEKCSKMKIRFISIYATFWSGKTRLWDSRINYTSIGIWKIIKTKDGEQLFCFHWLFPSISWDSTAKWGIWVKQKGEIKIDHIFEFHTW